jgi:hypothetical protein
MGDNRDAKLFGRAGGLRAWAQNGPDAMLSAARRGFMRRFELEVDPAGVLALDERARRAARARHSHMLMLSARSAQVRRARKAASAAVRSTETAREDADRGGEPRTSA